MKTKLSRISKRVVKVVKSAERALMNSANSVVASSRKATPVSTAQRPFTTTSRSPIPDLIRSQSDSTATVNPVSSTSNETSTGLIPVINHSIESAARKFSTSTTSRSIPSPGRTVLTNAESRVHIGSGLKAVSVIANNMAAIARADVSAARRVITSTRPAPAIRPRASDSDVLTDERLKISILGSKIKANNSVVKKLIEKATSLAIGKTKEQFIPNVKIRPKVVFENNVKVDIFSASVDTNDKKGTGDRFYSRIVFSIPAEDVENGNVKSISIFRSTIRGAATTKPMGDLSLHGISRIISNPRANRSKNDDNIGSHERILTNNGIVNDITRLNPRDKFLGIRTANKISSLTTPVITDVDRSLQDNNQFLNSMRLQDQNFGRVDVDGTIVAGHISPNNIGQAHIDNISSERSVSSVVVENNNAFEFRQVLATSHSKLSSKKIGNNYYYTFDDSTINYGLQYKYYVTTTNENMVQGKRSNIVTINVDGLRIPARPSFIEYSVNDRAVSFNIVADDHFVEKIEVWKKNITDAHFAIKRADNGYSFIAHVVNNGEKDGASWKDENVIPGFKYQYRFYSVDAFGNKSESPYEVDVFVPDRTSDLNLELLKPSIDAEVDSKTRKIRIIMRCPDKDVLMLQLERRDLTINQKNFIVPANINRKIFGTFKLKHSSYALGERIMDVDPETAWNGKFDNTTEDIVFIDNIAAIDRMYQYRVYGIDKFGRRTSYDYSSPVLLSRRSMIDSPVNLSTQLINKDGKVIGVSVSWQSSSLDISAEDKLGSVAAREDSAIRTLYQVERKKEGDNRWFQFDLTENSFLVDTVQGYNGATRNQSFKPPLLEINKVYSYRVQAVLSGGYLSNRTQQSDAFVTNTLLTPLNFDVKSSDPKVKPIFVALNWDTDKNSAIVDKWEIQRAEINNFAASKLNLRMTADFKKLEFKEFRTIYKESSRSNSFFRDKKATSTTGMLSGQHNYIDMKVEMGNTYVYRLVAVDTRGNVSQPVYKAIKMTYSSFDMLLDFVIDETKKKELTNSMTPMRLSQTISPEMPLNTASMRPEHTIDRNEKTTHYVRPKRK